MLWDSLRDGSLFMFLVGGLALAAGRVSQRQLGETEAALLAKIGDFTMIGSAGLAMAAMTFAHIAPA